ncbi:hypothetical protein ACVIJU_002444 [Aeribacillus sp. SP014]
MAHEKVWANNENLNKFELKKLEKDGLDILEEIDTFAKNGLCFHSGRRLGFAQMGGAVSSTA